MKLELDELNEIVILKERHKQLSYATKLSLKLIYLGYIM